MKSNFLTYIQHKIRQYTYRYKNFPKNPYCVFFDKVYTQTPETFPHISKVKDDSSYIHSQFIAPECQSFCGREIVYFNAEKLSIFWLPGATHSAGGDGLEGKYSVSIQGYSLKRNLLLDVHKNGAQAIISNVREKSDKPNQKVQRLNGGYVIYSAIEVELKALIQMWIKSLKSNNMTDKDHELINLAIQLPCEEIQKRAKQLTENRN